MMLKYKVVSCRTSNNNFNLITIKTKMSMCSKTCLMLKKPLIMSRTRMRRMTRDLSANTCSQKRPTLRHLEMMTMTTKRMES